MKRRGGFTLVELLIVIMIIAILAGMMLLATGSATDSAEATKVINDLRGVKSAALMFYADYNAWPTGAQVNGGSLDEYMDRATDSSRYGSLDVTEEDTQGRQYIGFDLRGPTATNGVKKKIAAKAQESGVYGSTGAAPGNTAFTAAHTKVWMNMR